MLKIVKSEFHINCSQFRVKAEPSISTFSLQVSPVKPLSTHLTVPGMTVTKRATHKERAMLHNSYYPGQVNTELYFHRRRTRGDVLFIKKEEEPKTKSGAPKTDYDHLLLFPPITKFDFEHTTVPLQSVSADPLVNGVLKTLVYQGMTEVCRQNH